MTTSPKMDDSLLPCPFCGNADVDAQFSAFQNIGDDDSKTRYDPGCMKCGASAPIAVWNRRALRQDSSGGVAAAWIEHHKGGDNLVWEQTRFPCTPLYAAPQESRSEVLDQSQADVVLHAHTEICDLFAQNSGNYDPSPDEVDRVHDGLTIILGNIATALSSRAEPGAQNKVVQAHVKEQSDLRPDTPESSADYARGLEIVLRHRRHIELSPGVGILSQQYALAVCDDIENDFKIAAEQELVSARTKMACSADMQVSSAPTDRTLNPASAAPEPARRGIPTLGRT